MITEDYVSFETAKLLKEKGFKEWCRCCYGLAVRHNGESIDEDEEFELRQQGREDELEYVYGGRLYDFGCSNLYEGSPYAAPTLQMAMKWLREEKEVFIAIGFCDYPSLHKSEWIPEISTHDSLFPDSAIAYDSYEEACESAIKYCLENLI